MADANQVLYLYVRGGPLTVQADGVFLRDPVWAAPTLWRSEVRNALVGMIREGHATAAEALAALDDAERLLADQEYEVASPDVLALAIKSGCTAYDCEYVALAEALDVPFVTSDRQVLRAFPGRAVSPEQFIEEG